MSDSNEKKESCWRRFLNCMRGKKKTQTAAVSKKQLDKNVSSHLDAWSNKQRTNDGQKNDERAQSVAFLKEQLERYEMEIALRQLLQLTKSTKQRKLKATDDRLPYELKPISKNWGLAISRLNRMKTTGKIPSYMGSLSEELVSPETAKTSDITVGDCIGVSVPSSPQPSSKEPFKLAETAKIAEKTPSGIVGELSVLLEPDKSSAKGQPSASTSTTTNLSNVEEMEKSSHLADLILEIMKDADEIKDDKPALPALTKENIAKLSHFEPQKFEHEIMENTKMSLLTSQPTNAETKNWDNGQAREKHYDRKAAFPKHEPEMRTFCKCRKTACAKNTKSP